LLLFSGMPEPIEVRFLILRRLTCFSTGFAITSGQRNAS
jgi:hypothetical protein